MIESLPPNILKFSPKLNSSIKKAYVFDIETDGLYDEATKIHCIVFYDIIGDRTYEFGPRVIDAALLCLAEADLLIGHNITNYDIPVIEKLWPETFTKKPFPQIIDTLLCTRLIWPKEKLYDLDTEQYSSVPPNLRGSAGLKAWGYRLSDKKINFKEFSTYSQEMLDYCKQDVSVTTKLFNHIQMQNIDHKAYQLEHSLAHCIQRQIRTGFPFDIDKCLAVVDDLESEKAKLEEELKTLFPPIKTETWFTPKVNNTKRGYVKGVPFRKVHSEEFNPGSRQQITDRLRSKYEWVPEDVTDKGNAILNDEVLAQLPYPEAKPLSRYMLLKKRLGQMKEGNNAWLKLVDEDSVMHGDLITNGCITGRASHRNPNMAQVPAAYSPYGKECRELFHAPNDWILIGSDAKALELRCLAGYLALWDDGEYGNVVIDDTQDIHTYNQKMFGVGTRDISKRLLYAVLYGAGFLKAGSIVNPNEKDPDELRSFGRTAINSFLKGIPALQELKRQLAATLGSRGFLIGLDKRPLYCRSEFKALNVLLQAAGAVIMKQVVINIHEELNDAGYVYGKDWVQHAFIHDEIQMSCRPGIEQNLIPYILNSYVMAGEGFDFLCKIEGDVKTGHSWYDTH